LPNTPLAAYTWGAYGNEVVPPFFAKPTLSVSYLPQPSWQLELILQQLTAQHTAPPVRESLMNALGIQRSLYRDDAAETKPLPKDDFGSEIARFGALHVLSNDRALPKFAIARTLDPVAGATAIATYAGLFHHATRGFASSDAQAICSGAVPLGLELMPTRHRGHQILDVPLNCSHPMEITLAVVPSVARTTTVEDSARRVILSLSKDDTVEALRWSMPPGHHTYLITSKQNSDVFLAIAGHAPEPTISATQARQFGWLGYRFDPLPYQHYAIFNQNFDPTWQGFVKSNGRWQRISNFMVDGFANGWNVPAQSPLIIINTLQIVVWISALLFLALLVAYLIFLRRALLRPLA